MVLIKEILFESPGVWPIQGHPNFNPIRPALHLGDIDVGDIVMLVILWWWLISDVGGRMIMLPTFFVIILENSSRNFP